MNLYPWAMLVFGILVGGAAMKAYCERKKLDVRVALGDLVHAVESERLLGSYVEVPGTPVHDALDRAHKVLER